jgi:O-antigen/teichoic acid export membrane protein
MSVALTRPDLPGSREVRDLVAFLASPFARPMTSASQRAISNRRFAYNMIWSLLGAGLPMLVAIVAVPTLIHDLGTARFGVLSIAWMVVGYFSLFDFGLGRALTQAVAAKLGRQEEAQIPEVVWTALVLMLALGVVGCITIAALTPWLVSSVLKIPESLKDETRTSFFILALSIPVVVLTTGVRGLLEAYQRFDLVNIVRVPLGVLTYLAPLLVLPLGQTLPIVVFVLVLVRLASCAAYVGMCAKLYPGLRRRIPLRSAVVRELLNFGGWMTVSNITAPFLLYLGRLLVAGMVSVEAVAYFSTPYDVVTNLLTIPAILVTVLFPVFTQSFQRDPIAAAAVYRRAMLYNFLALAPLCLATFVMAKPALSWWINPEFAAHAYRVAQFMALGVLINSFGHISQALIQAYGRPDLTAKLHIAELLAYVPYLWWLTKMHGIDGAALGWVIRVAISTAALWFIARRCLNTSLTADSRETSR